MIDTSALRSKIIDLAVKGKLTKQLEEDGNAQELYNQLQETKAELINKGLIKKEKELGEITESEIPFEIPTTWKWVRLRDICKKIVDGDHNPPVGVKEKTKYLMLSAQNINGDKLINIGKARYLTEDVFLEEDKRTRLEKGDVLLTIVATLGRSCVYKEELNVCFQRSVCVISTLINPDYLKKYFDSSYIQKFMKDNATGDAQPGFYLNKVERLCIPLPPMKEQKRIVELFEPLDSELHLIEKMQDSYVSDIELLKGKLIDAAIQGKLTEQFPEDGTAEKLYVDIQEEKAKLIKEKKIKKEKRLAEITEAEIPFDIPDHWKWVRLADVTNRVWAGGDKPNDFAPIAAEGRTIPVVANGVTDDGILGYTSEAKAPAETITVAGRGTIGFCTYRNYEYCPIVRLIVIEPSRGVNPKYLKLVMYALQERSVGSSIPQLTVPMIKPKLIPLPPYKEQLRIVDRIDEILSLI